LRRPGCRRPRGFTGYGFFVTFTGGVLGIVALSKFFLVEMRVWQHAVAVFAAVLLIAPGRISSLIGIARVSPIVLRHVLAVRDAAPVGAA